MLGVMIDCSRNAVMNVNSVKRYIDMLSKMGYDTLMLYTEDTYEVDNQPFFGYKRGRYSKEEIRAIDAYCISKNIELIPCIQTLAHLNAMFKWWDSYEDIRDYDDILLIGEEKTYKLIRDMFSSLADCFTSKNIHIGMDEAYQVGLGKYLQKHGYEARFDIINRHLHKVCEIADEFGFKPMIWSDMFCKLALENDNYYQGGNIELIKNKANLPNNISLVYWDYYSKDCERYKKNLKVNQAFGKDVIFAGGAWTWKGFIPDNNFSIQTTLAAVNACKECGVENIFFTIWGDDGAECSRFAVLPSLFYASQIMHGNYDENDIKEKFKEMFGMDFDSFLLFEKLESPSQHLIGNSPSKYLLYNDPFLGLHDYRLSGNENQYYTELLKELNTTEISNDLEMMFDYMKALCDVLSIKSELGMRTRKAYKDGNIASLKENITEYTTVIEKITHFHQVYQKWWMSENKPYGFEIQDIRMGGLIQRITSCRDRIDSYCNGSVDSITELEEEVLSADCGCSWARIVTTGVISHTV